MFNPNQPIVVTDIETGGLELSHPIIQVAAVVYHPAKKEILEEFERKIEFNPKECQAEALTINHYDEDAWGEAVSQKDAMFALSLLYKRHACATRTSKKGFKYQVAIGAGYNSHFDTDRLFHRARQHGLFLPVDPRFLDIMQLALWKQLPLESFKLTSVAEYFGIATDNAHDALADVKLTIAVMEELLNHD